MIGQVSDDSKGQVSEVSQLGGGDSGAGEVNADGVPHADKARSEPGGDGHREYGDGAGPSEQLGQENDPDDA